MAEVSYVHPALAALDGRLTITVEEAAAVLGLGRSAAYEAARRGELPSRRLGRRVIVPVPLLLEWLGISIPAA
jgi:excisionase family DNA binding protein